VYITGESYGGHYVPNFVRQILNHNVNGTYPGGLAHINIKGFQVGNAWTDAKLDNIGALTQWYNHALISEDTYEAALQTCDFSVIGPLKKDSDSDSDSKKKSNSFSPNGTTCNENLAIAALDMSRINIYDIYTDVCFPPQYEQTAHFVHLLRDAHEQYNLRSAHHGHRHGAGLGDPVPSGGEIPDNDPCISEHLAQYLNLPEVQSAIHALPTKWYGCSRVVDYSRESLLNSMLPVYEFLIANTINGRYPLNMLVYSGDVDGIVPIAGTRSWIKALKTKGALKVAEPWRPWFDRYNQTGGYTEKFDGLTFASIRDAGHMVPYTQPQRSLTLFATFLKTGLAPSGTV
jgi:serine carboxypeptidase-like clade II